jgi:hypothetical protein
MRLNGAGVNRTTRRRMLAAGVFALAALMCGPAVAQLMHGAQAAPKGLPGSLGSESAPRGTQDPRVLQDEAHLQGGPADPDADYLQPSGAAANAFFARDAEIEEALTPIETVLAAGGTSAVQIRSNSSGAHGTRALPSSSAGVNAARSVYAMPDLQLGQSLKAVSQRTPYDGVTVYRSPW